MSSDAASCRAMESPAPCHLRPSDKKRLATINAAKQAAAEQRVIKQRIKLLQVGYDLDSVHNMCKTV